MVDASPIEFAFLANEFMLEFSAPLAPKVLNLASVAAFVPLVGVLRMSSILLVSSKPLPPTDLDGLMPFRADVAPLVRKPAPEAMPKPILILPRVLLPVIWLRIPVPALMIAAPVANPVNVTVDAAAIAAVPRAANGGI